MYKSATVPLIFTFPERVILEQFFDRLKDYELAIDEDFQRKEGRWPQPADKVYKIVEELGEVKKATNKLDEIEEIWDSAIASIGQALLKQYSTEQIINGLERVMQKLEGRWGHANREKSTQ